MYPVGNLDFKLLQTFRLVGVAPCYVYYRPTGAYQSIILPRTHLLNAPECVKITVRSGGARSLPRKRSQPT